MIDFVAVCRTYASELAINEVTLRTYSDLQQYVEKSTESRWCSRCAAATPRTRGYRQMQVKAAIRFCEVLFGQDYASLMSRAAENALTVERKASRVGETDSENDKLQFLVDLKVRGTYRFGVNPFNHFC